MRATLKKTLFALFLGSVTLAAHAQPGMGQGQMQPSMQLSEQQQQMMAQMQQKQQQLQKTQQSLQAVQMKVIEKSPALQQKQTQLRSKLQKQMNKGGYDAEAEIAALNAMAKKYQNSDKKPSAKEVQEFRQREARLKERQAQAWQNPEVQKLAQSLEQDVMQKVKNHSADSSQLVQKFESQVKALQQLRSQLQQSMSQ